MSNRAAIVAGGLITAALAAGLWAIAMYWIGSATTPNCSDAVTKALCEPDWFARRVFAFVFGLPVAGLSGVAGASLTNWVLEGPSK